MLVGATRLSCGLPCWGRHRDGNAHTAVALLGTKRRPAAEGPAIKRPFTSVPRTVSKRIVSVAFKDGDADGQLYQGVYGAWRITDKDRVEVWSYRIGISVLAAAFAAGTATALAPPDAAWGAAGREAGTWIAAAGAAGLGGSLLLIHMYVTELKLLLQAFWALGVVGGIYLAATNEGPLPEYVFANPSSVWLIGPAFAALTGVAVKEGLCYGKKEAFALTLLTPALLLGHLTGLLPPAAEHVLGVAEAALLLLFAARKYTQPLKEDIGDGSVFLFNAMTPEEQAAKLARLRADGEVLQQRDDGNAE